MRTSTFARSTRHALAALAALAAACGGDSGTGTPDASVDAADQALCGNNQLDGDEQCDDGDQAADATCDERCRFTCGNGTVEANLGELCDRGITAGAGACPSTCDDGMACTQDVLSGSDCQAACVNQPITAPASGDGCCPPGANSLSDDDCDVACGNGIVEAGELCDTGITAGAGACPTTCDDQQACTTDALTMGGTCQAACTNTAITAPANGDGCCPAGASTGNDNDCQPGCGNGVVDSGETCDTAITTGTGACPTTCSDGVACTRDVLGGAGTCQAACTYPAINSCANGDGCCPTGCNATNDDSCMPRCGNGVLEGTEQCDDGNMNDGDQCTNQCRRPITAFRFTDLDVKDPHIFVSVLGCNDVTNPSLVPFSVNAELQKNIEMDNDGDGDLDLSPTLVFRGFNQTAATQPVELHFATCTVATQQNPTVCRPDTAAPIMATATFMSTGSCLGAAMGTVRPYSPAVTASTGPCFVTDAVTVTIDLGGIPITLRDARIAATYVGNPATTLSNGLLRGFISEADANNTIIPMSFPIVGGRPLSSLLPGGTNNCNSGDDRDTNNGVRGWWFYLNYPAARTAWMD